MAVAIVLGVVCLLVFLAGPLRMWIWPHNPWWPHIDERVTVGTLSGYCGEFEAAGGVWHLEGVVPADALRIAPGERLTATATFHAESWDSGTVVFDGGERVSVHRLLARLEVSCAAPS